MIGKKWNDTRLQNLQKTCGDCTNRRCGSQSFFLCFFCVRCVWGMFFVGARRVLRPIREWSFYSSRLSGTEGRKACGVSPPHGEILLFRQKDPKPWAPRRGPSGAFASVPNGWGCGTRCAQTVLALILDSGLRRSRACRRPGFGAMGWRCFLPSVIPDSIGDPGSLLLPVFAKRTTLDPRRLTGSPIKSGTSVEDDRKRKDKDNDTGSSITNVEDDRKRGKDDRKRNDGGAQRRLQAPLQNRTLSFRA